VLVTYLSVPESRARTVSGAVNASGVKVCSAAVMMLLKVIIFFPDFWPNWFVHV